MSKDEIKKPRGTFDILPDDFQNRDYLLSVLEKEAKALGFKKIETPIFEDIKLYQRSLGETSDIVEKEMFMVQREKNVREDDEGEEGKTRYVLRPEGTASIARAYLEDGLTSLPKPLKLYYYGPMFRYGRPQKGRFRQFYQFGLEILGEEDPSWDALILLMLFRIFKTLGIMDDLTFQVNSLGCLVCRPKIKKALVSYYQNFLVHLCPDCQRRIKENPLRLLDCKEDKCQTFKTDAPVLLDSLCDECKKHFRLTLEALDELSVPYDLNPTLVRGLDYYTKTTFEVVDKKNPTAQASLGGGGRYDELVELYGGPKTPALGVALGMERILEKMAEKEVKIPKEEKMDICVVQISEKAKNKVLPLIAQLRSDGYKVLASMGNSPLKSQLSLANQSGAKLCLIMGQREVLDNSIIIRNMLDGTQDTVDLKDLKAALKKSKSKLKI